MRNPDITLVQILQAKDQAEEEIRNTLLKFSNTTGLRVIDFDYVKMDLVNGEKVMSFRSLKIELPLIPQKHLGL